MMYLRLWRTSKHMMLYQAHQSPSRFGEVRQADRELGRPNHLTSSNMNHRTIHSSPSRRSSITIEKDQHLYFVSLPSPTRDLLSSWPSHRSLPRTLTDRASKRQHGDRGELVTALQRKLGIDQLCLAVLPDCKSAMSAFAHRRYSFHDEQY